MLRCVVNYGFLQLANRQSSPKILQTGKPEYLRNKMVFRHETIMFRHETEKKGFSYFRPRKYNDLPPT